MNRIFTASYQFAFGEINFQVDIDETLYAQKKLQDYPVTLYKSLHQHPFFELFFVFDDEIETVFENGAQKHSNCIVCLPPNTRHYTIRSSDYRILFSYISNSNSKVGFEGFISDFFSTGKPCNIIIPPSESAMKEYFKELCDVFYHSKSDLDEEVIVSILQCILYRMYSLYSSTGDGLNNRNHFINESRYITISSLITRCTTKGNEITISNIADALCLSKKQTSRLIYKYYGRSLSQVITEEKLNYAAHLLRKTNISICDVALESNFNSYSYFCRCFKEKFGCMPLHYRKGI